MNAQSTLQRKVQAMLERYSASTAGAPARSDSIMLSVSLIGPPLSLSSKDLSCFSLLLPLSLSHTHCPSSPQPLAFEPAPLDFHSEKLGNRILAFHCPLREHKTSLLKALKLTARSPQTLPSQCVSTYLCLQCLDCLSHLSIYVGVAVCPIWDRAC